MLEEKQNRAKQTEINEAVDNSKKGHLEALIDSIVDLRSAKQKCELESREQITGLQDQVSELRKELEIK